MALWSLADIQTEIRKLAGRPSTSNPTDAQLNERIDRYIRFKLPAEVKFQLQRRFYNLTVTDGTGSYTFPADFQSFESLAFVGDDPMEVFFDPTIFWNRWLIDSTETESKPQDLLIYDNDIVVRPVPDQSYTIRILGNKRLDEFTSAADTTSLAGIDGQEAWGEVVAYGVAIDLLVAGGEYDKAAGLKLFYDRVRSMAQDATAQMFVGQRSVPMF